MRYFPAFLDLKGRRCLVVGGGSAAASKARLLLKAGAEVTVVAPAIGNDIAELAARGMLTAMPRCFAPDDVAGCALVHGATGSEAVDTAVSSSAHAAGIPVNVVDRPDLSSFVMPAIVDRDPIVVGISTGGASPVLARRLRETIEGLLPSRLGRLARFADKFRDGVRANFADASARRRFWERFFDGPVADAVLRGDERGARERMLTLVNRPARAAEPSGVVHIVGAGPGDPDLLTLRALRLIQQADTVIYDKLVGAAVLDLVRRDAERIYVGKSKANHSRTQPEINSLMSRHAKAGKRVVRLKGGDPFIFGRGSEEVDYLRAEHVPVEVVPGITAATGCAATTGIPLTHRAHASAVTFISGHTLDDHTSLDWASLARTRQTLVVYMGVSTAGITARRLIENGMDPRTPAAVIENGTLPNEKLVVGTVATLERMVMGSDIAGPALIVIGDVVRQIDSAAAVEQLHARAV